MNARRARHVHGWESLATPVAILQFVMVASALPIWHKPHSLPPAQTDPKLAGTPVASLIVPGRSVGPVRLGDSRDVVLRHFPLKADMDSEYEWTKLRTEIRWLDVKDSRVKGFISFSIRDGRVFQIQVATNRFETGEGIAVSSSPEEVKRRYGKLKAFALMNSGGKEIGGRDLIYWVSESRGVAFEFAFFADAHTRLVSKIIIFEPGTLFLPGGSVLPPRKWIELRPFSLTPTDGML